MRLRSPTSMKKLQIQMSHQSLKISKLKTPEVSLFVPYNLALVLDEEADLTWIYITAIVVGVVILAVSIVVLTSYRQEKQTNTNAMRDRNKEPAQWGIRMLESNNIIFHDRRSDSDSDDTPTPQGNVHGNKRGECSSLLAVPLLSIPI